MDNDKTQVLNPAADDQVTRVSPAPQDTQLLNATQVLGDDARTRVQLSARTSGTQRILGVGDTIKQRFVLDRLLGMGGMGAVFRALDLRKQEAGDQRPYIALKVLGEEFKEHPQALITLQREAKKTQELAHPNIVTVYDFDRDGDLVYLTMEELEGQSLNQWLEARGSDKRLALRERLDLIRQLAEGLSYAHSKGIVHSDLKPANVFVTRTGRVKILDFGIARAANEEVYQDSFDAGDLGAVTFPYASPEMLRFEPPHPSDDIYALGVIACELLGGGHPFRGLDAESAQRQGQSPNLPKAGNWLLHRLLARTLHLKRAQRVPDAASFLKQLNRALNGPRNLVLGGGILVLAVVANYAYLEYTRVPEGVPFSSLSLEQQQAFRDYLNESQRALRFGDLQGAVVNIDRAYAIHTHNDEVRNAINHILGLMQRNIEQAQDAQQREFFEQQLQQLRQYAAFAQGD